MVCQKKANFPRSLLLVLLSLAQPVLLLAQDLEVAVGGGGGFIDGETARTAVGGLGASMGWPASSRHKLQFDYLFADFENRIFSSQFLTGSYVLQFQRRGVRPFFQVGAGAEIQRFSPGSLNLPPDIPLSRVSLTSADFTVLLGVGASIDLGRSFFIRPEVRSYFVVGPNAVVLPNVQVGWRF